MSGCTIINDQLRDELARHEIHECAKVVLSVVGTDCIFSKWGIIPKLRKCNWVIRSMEVLS